jgi:hypothetical protein
VKQRVRMSILNQVGSTREVSILSTDCTAAHQNYEATKRMLSQESSTVWIEGEMR